MNFSLNLSLGNFIYCLSLAFQVAGAVLVILKYWGNTQDRILKEYFPGKCIFERDNDDKIKIDIDDVRNCVIRIYENRISFIFIAIGYFISVFGNQSDANSFCLAILLIILTVMILKAEKIGVRYYANKKYNENMLVPYDKVKDFTEVVSSEAEIMESCFPEEL